MPRFAAALVVALAVAPAASAGLHVSTDATNPLPAEWRGFLLDCRMLRVAANPKAGGVNGSSPLRDTFADAALALQAKAKTAALTADESADLGGLLVRICQPEKAVAVLRVALREHPEHFRTAANLGTAWQMAGDLAQAAAALEEAVALAPKEWQAAEKLHLKLVRGRAKEKADPGTPDDLFGVEYVGESGTAEAGVMAAKQKAKLPADAIAQVQQLCVWLPGDARLLWQLAELANARGDVRTAATLLDGCVTDLGIKADAARDRRKLYRAAADNLDKNPEHDAHADPLRFASPRVLARRIDEGKLPKVNPTGVNPLPWAALGETEVGKKFAVKTLRYVADLDGKTVSVSGYMAPQKADAVGEFLLVEYAVGCWFCDTPGPTQIVQVELADGKTTPTTRGTLTVTGTLAVNRTDPERLLFTLRDAKVKAAE